MENSDENLFVDIESFPYAVSCHQALIFWNPCPRIQCSVVYFVFKRERTGQESIEMTSLSRDPSQFLPKEAREQFRKNNLTHISCSQFCAGYLQSNIACLPSNMADDFERLCINNSSPFPLLYRSQPGEVSAPPLASDSDVR